MNQKRYHEKTAKALPELSTNQTIRLQTEKGHEKIGFVKAATENPRSYIVNVNGKEYRRNRQHLLPVGENRPSASPPIEPASAAAAPRPSYADKVKSSSPMSRDQPVTSSQPIKTGEDGGAPATSNENKQSAYTTRSGRTSKPPSRYA